jgi:hypothetical protein
MKIRSFVSGKMVAISTLLAVGSVSLSASAQTSGALAGLSSVLTGLDTTDVIAAIVGAGALLAGVGFAKWATKKVGKFFG